MTRVYLVRHCEAEGNHKRIFQGHTDADVSEMGKRQLSCLAERFRGIPLDAIYSSPLRRALETARAVNRYHDLEIQVEDDLIEINGGCWEGKLWSEFPVKYPALSDDWDNAPYRFAPQGGESMREVYDRIWRGITGIVERHPGQTVCIASHGCAIRNFLCRAQGLPIERLNEVPWCDNTGVSIVDFSKGRPQVITMNDASHLQEGLSTFATQEWWQRYEHTEG
jgi:broad specificity phosphatase PhoE